MMVSNVQDSAPAPPLSYADRVKKSQRKGSPASGSAQRPQSRTQPSSSISAPSSTRGVAKPPADGSSARPQEAATATDCTIPPLLDSTRTSFANPINGEANLNVQALAAAPSSSTGKKAAVPPKANVWTQRTEKMAKVLSQQTSRATDVPAQPLPSSDDASHTGVAAASPSQAPTIPPTVKEVDPVVGEVTSAPNAADIRISAEDDEDAWVVRPHLAPTAVPLPALDASSWPEVGQAPSGDAVSSSQTANSGGEPENKAKKGTQGSGTKRGEKQRWVPIPAEELRAAADAHRSAQASHSRSQSQQSSRNRGQNSASGSAGRSKNASLERSKIQPSGNRDRPSASQSEMHSRAGSMQSSPRHVPTRLRRPPDDVGGSSSRKSSRATSPRPYSSTSVPTATGAVELPQGPGHQHEGVNGTVYYPGIPRTHVPSAYSATPPYPPPPGAVPITYNPSYPYAPYPYGAPPGQPYPMFWPAIHQDPRHQYAMSSQSQSPATHPSSLTRSDDVSPPTSAGPSPTEERTEVSVVPVHAGAMSVSSDAQKSAAENKPSRGRQRILSFGSIRADGKIVGDEGGSDATEIVAADTEKSSSLGLDVGSLSVNDNADVTPRNGERPTFKLNAETPAFSIRVARRDPNDRCFHLNARDH
ncbi:hypothetical protein PHLGIDRAFT_287983 [Phlebiopsis gigantea 11061_1 CR5-6]|uniref:Uncharacterized protein n=1 Tax=Phlebiopsis gigantea (strain 11061_1 CR5-6) TaxID=745531 RepID=A0A0C3NWW1_PHLG1|nr:hypothetical protein PHLGIDRAFT_287983 [Phlebiopsis gigantea 11061_1 CR5-6]